MITSGLGLHESIKVSLSKGKGDPETVCEGRSVCVAEYGGEWKVPGRKD